ncbi:hypothetical protein [Streptomyces sp. NPDC001404]|uniref:hypothetical protein n=1 Tax=Streptomyces sp. NPDC001404 TaxID=3364571 RepID=UPI0036B165AB
MGEKRKSWWFCVDFADASLDGSSREGMGGKGVDLKRRADSSFIHAEYRIKNHLNRFDRIDAVLALKRAMQTRLDHLNAIYNFKQYPQCRDQGWLGLLESWGVIRQRMLRRMRQLRNAVEHDNAEPPSLEECQDYCEVVWWFLRGTSPLLAPVKDVSLVFGNGSETSPRHAGLSLDFCYDPVTVDLWGHVLPEMLSDSPIDGWVQVQTQPHRWASDGDLETPSRVRPGALCIDANVSDPGLVGPFLEIAFKELL